MQDLCPSAQDSLKWLQADLIIQASRKIHPSTCSLNVCCVFSHAAAAAWPIGKATPRTTAMKIPTLAEHRGAPKERRQQRDSHQFSYRLKWHLSPSYVATSMGPNRTNHR